MHGHMILQFGGRTAPTNRQILQTYKVERKKSRGHTFIHLLVVFGFHSSRMAVPIEFKYQQSASALLIWNSLPTTICNVSISINSFSARLKAELFHSLQNCPSASLTVICKTFVQTQNHLLQIWSIFQIARVTSVSYTHLTLPTIYSV